MLQLMLCAVAEAAPIQDESNNWHYGTSGGVVGIVVVVLDIMAWMEILKSDRPPMSKLLWDLIVFLFPVVGVVMYHFSNRDSHRNDGYEPVGP
jgi:low temperature requirement protein LtrA